MGWNPVKEAEKAAKKAVDKVLKPAQKAAEDAIWKVRREAYAKVKQVEKESESHLKNVGKEIEDGITEKLPDMVEDVAKELAKKASQESIKEVLENAADVIETLAPSKFTFIFGMELALVVQGEVTVSFTIPNPVAKLTEIRGWVKKPPKGRSQIIECIKDFGPETIAAEGKISGNGVNAEWDGEEKYDRVDAFLKKHGVK